jgi:uncharacterized protein (TIGR02453 family)
MATAFGGFPEAGYEFLRELKENNRREWFQPRKEMYEATVKAPLGELVEALNAEFARFAPEYITEPKRAIYRIYRDVRFSKEKHPYKTNAAAGFHASAVEKESLAGYYVSVSPFEIEIAGGIYMPRPEQMLAIRNRIAEGWEEWAALVGDKRRQRVAGEVKGEALTRTPKGFAKEHPAEFWLRKKQWLYWDTGLDPALALRPGFVKEIARRFEAMYPVIRFLNGALGGRKALRSEYF